MLVRATKHADIDYGALSAHLFRCMFSRLSLSLLGLTFQSLLVDLERMFKTLFVMSCCHQEGLCCSGNHLKDCLPGLKQ